MKERPILFSGPMVRAILGGRKTQTRRVAKLSDASGTYAEFGPDNWPLTEDESGDWHKDRCPYGATGDQLWVKETWLSWRWNDNLSPRDFVKNWGDRDARYYVGWLADDDTERQSASGPVRMDGRIRPSIHMPRWASRITLEVVSVRVERLNDISPHDALAEGVRYQHCDECPPDFRAVNAFRELWDSINAAKHPWASNPFVWVVEFKRLETGR